jgi:putative ABC transport system permease protein
MMGIPLLTGRELSDSDSEKSAGVVIVSAATAQRFWPGENPVGKHIRLVWDKDWRTVVGVAGDVRQFNLAGKPLDWIQGSLYMPYSQSVDANQKLPTAMYLIARTSAGTTHFARDIRGLVAAANPNVPVGEVRTLEAIVSDSASHSRSMMWLFISFAGSALLLAAIGTYGVVSYSAAQRTFEIGVRMALGASRGNILGLVLGQSLQLVLGGLLLGVAASAAVTRMLTTFLYGLTATDPVTFLAVGILLLGVGLLAGYLPARRAAGVNPLTALRVE